jgi:hypothetical protein
MIHSIKKAKEKWCPMARFYMGGESGVAGINRTFHDNIPLGTECIAAECMWWKISPGGLTGYCGKVGREGLY